MGPATQSKSTFPYVSVEDVWRGALPVGTEVAAGRSGLRREVVWCTALRARAPAFEPLRGGELVLVNPDILGAVDPRLTLPRLVDSLSAHGIAAAGVTGRLSPEARRAADRHGLPLLALPRGPGPALEVIEQQVLRFIVDRRAELHERTQDLHRQLSELALAGRGLNVLLSRLTELVGVPVLLERGTVVEYVTAGRDRTLPAEVSAAVAAEQADLHEWLRDVPLSAFDPPVASRALPGGRSRLVAPILVQGSIAGFLSLIGHDGELSEVHRLAAGRAAHACAIELVRASAARAARDEVEEELLDALIATRPGAHDSVRERARRKGIDPDAAYLMLAAEAGATERSSKVRAAWERSCAGLRLPVLARERGGLVLALIGLTARRAPDLRGLVAELHRSGRIAAGGPLSIGYGAPKAGARQVEAAAREAEQALRMGRRLFGDDRAVAFADLGLYRLLAALQPAPELGAFQDEMLSQLRERDRGGALLATLEAYLATNGSPTETAGRLRLHRNTVLYRLGRIETLLGIDLRDADARLQLHLALKIAHVLESEVNQTIGAPARSGAGGES